MGAVIEEFTARGHPNVRATHPTTLEITKDPSLTPRGDCIIAVKSEKGARDLSQEFKRLARRDDSIIVLELEADGVKDVVVGRGSSRLSFDDPRSMVFRRSDYACGRTVMVLANKAARDLSRELIEKLKDPSRVLRVRLRVELPR